jgi:hypothetical protein
MPAAITHFLQAEKVMEELKNQNHDFSKQSDALHRNAFLWGAQGPDFLYCHRYLPWQRGKSLMEYAEKLHNEQPSRLFNEMRDYYNASGKDDMVLSYLYGFVCHYCLDRVGHPFINYVTKALLEQNPEKNEAILHNQIESSLDVIMLRYEKADLPSEFNLKWAVPKDESVQTKIADLYAFVLNRLYNLEDAGIALLQATNDCHKLFGLLNDRTTMKKPLIERFESHKGLISCHIRAMSEGDEYDYANILHADWHWPMDSSTLRNEDFFELYGRSVTESLGLIRSFLYRENFNKETNEIPFV